MSDEIREYPAEDLRGVEPVRFRLGGQEFRVNRRTNTQVLAYLARTAIRLEGGSLVHDAATLRNAIGMWVASEVWDAFVPSVDDEGATVWEVAPVDDQDGVPVMGRWVQVDDRDRFFELIDSERVSVSADTLGLIVRDLTEELTGHPTGAPST